MVAIAAVSRQASCSSSSTRYVSGSAARCRTALARLCISVVATSWVRPTSAQCQAPDSGALAWDELSDVQQEAASKLGWSHELWDCGRQVPAAVGATTSGSIVIGATNSSSLSKGCEAPSSEGEVWAQLSINQRHAAHSLGWTAATWDCNEVSLGCNAPEAETKQWADLSSNEAAGAAALGWTPQMWDCSECAGPLSTTLKWKKLTVQQQEGAGLLGWTHHTWNCYERENKHVSDDRPEDLDEERIDSDEKKPDAGRHHPGRHKNSNAENEDPGVGSDSSDDSGHSKGHHKHDDNMDDAAGSDDEDEQDDQDDDKDEKHDGKKGDKQNKHDNDDDEQDKFAVTKSLTLRGASQRSPGLATAVASAAGIALLAASIGCARGPSWANSNHRGAHRPIHGYSFAEDEPLQTASAASDEHHGVE